MGPQRQTVRWYFATATLMPKALVRDKQVLDAATFPGKRMRESNAPSGLSARRRPGYSARSAAAGST